MEDDQVEEGGREKGTEGGKEGREVGLGRDEERSF